MRRMWLGLEIVVAGLPPLVQQLPERNMQILELRGYKYTCPYFSFNIICQKTNPKNKYFDKKGPIWEN